MSQGVKGDVRSVPGGQRGGLRYPIGSMATFDGSSNELFLRAGGRADGWVH